MIKISNGIHPIQWGKHYINSRIVFYAFNSTTFLRHISPHTNLKLQPWAVMKSQIIPSSMGTYPKNPLGNVLYTLTHFKYLHSIINDFFSCLFPSIVDDTHIIGPLSIVSSTYKHFQTKLYVIGLSIQPQKCVAWSPFSLPLNFNTPSQFTIPLKGIKIFKVPLGTSSLTSSFIKDTLLKDIQHVDLFFRMGDVQIAFGILTHFFMQWSLCFLQCTPPSSTFIKSLISFDSSLLR